MTFSGSLNESFHFVAEVLPGFFTGSNNDPHPSAYCDKSVFHTSNFLGSPLVPYIPLVLVNDTEISRQSDHQISMNYRNNDSSASVSSSFTPTRNSEIPVCRIYMAPSTIPGAGYGLFAGIPYQKGDLVTPGDGIVPVYDMEVHNMIESPMFLWDEYVWSGETFSGMSEFDRTIDAASFGIGALPNCFFPFINVKDSNEHGRDYANVDVLASPGIGAFSPWHDRKSYATQNIIAGSELFVDYGYDYFNSRKETFGLVPYYDHYKQANRLLKRFTFLSDRFLIEDTSIKESLVNDLYQISQLILIAWPNIVLDALPNSTSLISTILSNGGTAHKDYLRSIRSIDYLTKFGACMDHLHIKSSQIPEAGRGVFTERFFAKGSVVSIVPLIHIKDRSVLNIYEDTSTNRSVSRPTHQQLLLNYCFGHNKSSLLLCPYGIVSSLINHSPLINDQEIKNNLLSANLEIRWSTKFSRNLNWLNLSLSEWAHQERSGLAFEYVALRDIMPEEELLVDYGIKWQHAWNKHSSNWKKIDRKIDSLNQAFSVVPTEKEWKWPIGDILLNTHAVNLWCYSAYLYFQGLFRDNTACPCKVILRTFNKESNIYFYTAELFIRRQNEGRLICDELFDGVLFSVPRDAFVYGDFFSLFDTRQYLMPQSFRHDIQIPDFIMPQSWKNLE